MTFLKAPLDRWLAAVQVLPLRGADPNENLLWFPLADAQAASLAEEEITAFLLEAGRDYCRKATAPPGNGWFYAWVDEQAGQLRCSFCRGQSTADLPFGARLQVVDDPALIAQQALASAFASGIPWGALRDAPTTEEEEESEFVLTVFVLSNKAS